MYKECVFLKTFPLIINSWQYHEKVYLHKSIQIICVKSFIMFRNMMDIKRIITIQERTKH